MKHKTQKGHLSHLGLPYFQLQLFPTHQNKLLFFHDTENVFSILQTYCQVSLEYSVSLSAHHFTNQFWRQDLPGQACSVFIHCFHGHLLQTLWLQSHIHKGVVYSVTQSATATKYYYITIKASYTRMKRPQVLFIMCSPRVRCHIKYPGGVLIYTTVQYEKVVLYWRQ